ncbi:MAG: class I SAM-dependent methyltransferase [Clostridiales bacterium]|nr:class I SAM-dependent methyltransferase [Clostridiales bacterium]
MSKNNETQKVRVRKGSSGLLVLPEKAAPLIYPMYSRARLSREGIIIKDKKAESIVERVEVRAKRANFSRLATLYTGILTSMLDDHVEAFLADHPGNAVVLHLGCGLDSRIDRVKGDYYHWYDVDLSYAITTRRRFYKETDRYTMVATSVTGRNWLDPISEAAKGHPVVIVAEGLFMYLKEKEVNNLIINLCNHFPLAVLMFDSYSLAGANRAAARTPAASTRKERRAGKAGDPLMGWGLDDPALIEALHPSIRHLKTLLHTDSHHIKSLSRVEQFTFKMIRRLPVYNHLYRIYFFSIISPTIASQPAIAEGNDA